MTHWNDDSLERALEQMREEVLWILGDMATSTVTMTLKAPLHWDHAVD